MSHFVSNCLQKQPVELTMVGPIQLVIVLTHKRCILIGIGIGIQPSKSYKTYPCCASLRIMHYDTLPLTCEIGD